MSLFFCCSWTYSRARLCEPHGHTNIHLFHWVTFGNSNGVPPVCRLKLHNFMRSSTSVCAYTQGNMFCHSAPPLRRCQTMHLNV